MAGQDDLNAYEYIEIGFHLRALLYTSNTECRWVIKEIKEAIPQLDKFGLTYPKTELQAACKVLEELVRKSGETTKPPEDVATRLRNIVDCVHATVRTQAKDQRLVLLKTAAVSAKLRALAATGTLDTTQTYLFNETVMSLETGAYRSAIVMGWGLAYDILRRGVYGDAARLVAFNTELARIVDRSGNPKFDPINDYTDFYDVGERVVLDVCRTANLLGGNLYDDFRGYLRQRNTYAHASDFQPTDNQANGFIDHLVDALAKL
jgi:hypothetical protein